jgi:phage-related minor tail protein
MPSIIDRLVVEVGADTSGFTAALEEMSRGTERFGSSIAKAFEDIAIRGRSFGEAFNSLALSVSRQALRSSLAPLQNELSGVVGALAPQLFGLVKGALPLVKFARGGVLDHPALAALSGPRLGLMGEAGPEAVLPLARGPDGRLGVRAGGAAAPVAVTFNVTAGDAESFRRSEAQITAMLARAVERGRRAT